MPTPQPDQSVTVVTGANSGIGRATAVHLATKGHLVYGTLRNPEAAGKLNAMADAAGVTVHLAVMDIAHDDSVADALAGVLSEAGRIDNLVNNAGVGGNAVTAESTPSQHLEVMNVNLCGALRCIKAVLPQMRARRSGTIINITSVAGRIAALAQSPYVTSKWALEGMSEGLAQELVPFGIRVAIIEPGVTKSSIFSKNVDAPNSSGEYDAHYRRLFQFYAAGMNNATDPVEVGEAIYHAITTEHPQLRYPCSWGAMDIVLGRKVMTDEQWVALGSHADDAEYYAAFERHFGLDLRL